MSTGTNIFSQLMRSAPYQPATNYWRAVELDVVRRHGLPGSRILDLGCGDGKLTTILIDLLDARMQATWIGVDPDPEETKLAKQSGVYDYVVTCPGQEIPEPSKSFDLVFSNSVLEHIHEIDPVIKEVARLLKQGGRFVFTVPSSDFHSCLAGPLLGSASQEYLDEIDKRCAHVRYWSIDQWKEQLGCHNLEISSHASYMSTKQTKRWELASNLTGGLLYRLHGRTSRPIDIQRRLGMRGPKNGVLNAVFRFASRAILTNCAPTADAPDKRYSCLMVEATKI